MVLENFVKNLKNFANFIKNFENFRKCLENFLKFNENLNLLLLSLLADSWAVLHCLQIFRVFLGGGRDVLPVSFWRSPCNQLQSTLVNPTPVNPTPLNSDISFVGTDFFCIDIYLVNPEPRCPTSDKALWEQK